MQPASGTGYDLVRHAEDVRQLIKVLGLKRPVVLGFSLGGPVGAAVATRCDLGGLILLEGAIGNRAFLQQRGTETVVPTGETLDLRFTSVDEYLRRWRAENPRYSDEAERWIDRFARFELAPLPDGTFRRRALRKGLHAEFASVVEGDTLARDGDDGGRAVGAAIAESAGPCGPTPARRSVGCGLTHLGQRKCGF